MISLTSRFELPSQCKAFFALQFWWIGDNKKVPSFSFESKCGNDLLLLKLSRQLGGQGWSNRKIFCDYLWTLLLMLFVIDSSSPGMMTPHVWIDFVGSSSLGNLLWAGAGASAHHESTTEYNSSIAFFLFILWKEVVKFIYVPIVSHKRKFPARKVDSYHVLLDSAIYNCIGYGSKYHWWVLISRYMHGPTWLALKLRTIRFLLGPQCIHCSTCRRRIV